MIRTFELTKRYGRVRAVDRLNLHVGRGELFGFLGPNGAGKTTTIQILATLLAPSSGRAEIGGLDVRRKGREVRRRIGYMPDLFGVYDNLTVLEYLEFFGAAYDVAPADRRRILDDVLELTDLGAKRGDRVGALSRGMQQRLGLARVLVHDPEVLLLDEPASGLDPRARIEVRAILKELRAMGKTILLSSHILTEIAEVCTSLGIILDGRLVAAGPLAEVLARAGVGNVVRVRVEAPVDGAPELLRDCDGIERVDVLEDGEIRAFVADARIGAADVARVLVSGGVRLTRLESETIDLEEAYLRLTDGAADDR